MLEKNKFGWNMLSIIIPTLNEEEGIAKTICSIPKEIRDKSEVIVVDASNDYTPIISERLGAKLIKSKKRGKGLQMKEGVKESKGDTLIFMDGDGEYLGQYIPELLEKLKTANLVLGCRTGKKFKSGSCLTRIFFNSSRIFFSKPFCLFGINISEALTGFRAIRRKDWDRLNLKSNSFEIETEINIKATKEGFEIKEVIVPNFKRCGGVAKSKFTANPKMWFGVMRLFLKYYYDEKLKVVKNK